MKPSLPLIALLAALGLSACVAAEEDTYPLTGEECTAEDPVQDFGATDCVPVAGTGVGGL